MKKLAGMVLIVLAVVVMNCTAVFASDTSAMAAIPQTAGVVSSLYDFFVISQTSGRSGLTQTGAKGIMLEADAMNRMNLKNLLNGVSTQMSESSIDPAYDLVVMAKDGGMEKGIQCKAGVSRTNVYETVNKIIDGYYPEGTEFVGTTESSKAVNASLEKAGSDIRMVDSGISDARVNELARKALGNPITAKEVLKRMGSSAACFAIVDMGIAGIESYVRGDDAAEAISHVSVSGAEGAITGAIGSLAASGAESILILVGAGTAATNIVPIIVCVGTTVVIMYVLDNVAEETNLEMVITDAVRKAGTGIKTAAENTWDWAEDTAEDIRCAAVEAATDVTGGMKAAQKKICDVGNEAGTFVRTGFENTFMRDKAVALVE